MGAFRCFGHSQLTLKEAPCPLTLSQTFRMTGTMRSMLRHQRWSCLNRGTDFPMKDLMLAQQQEENAPVRKLTQTRRKKKSTSSSLPASKGSQNFVIGH